MNEGFALGKGQRSGFMGATFTVDNQGIFLSDNKQAARFFGEDRSGSPGEAQVLTCYADTSRVMPAEQAPREILRLGVSIINKYDNSNKSRLAVRDWWRLLDRGEFVSAIKKMGYTGVSFREDAFLNLPGRTYLIFDPSTIKIRGKQGDGINNVRDFFEHLRAKSSQTMQATSPAV